MMMTSDNPETEASSLGLTTLRYMYCMSESKAEHAGKSCPSIVQQYCNRNLGLQLCY